MAALATMLVRYRRFRHILIFERRAWPDRLTFALSLGVPLAAGVVRAAAAALRRRRPHARRGVPRRADRRPVRRRHGRRDGRRRRRSSTANGSRCPSRSAAASPAAASASCVRRKRSGTSRRSSSRSLPRRAWQMLRTLQVDWQVVLLLAPVALELLAAGARRALERASPAVLSRARRRRRSWTMLVVLLATVLVRRDADQDLEQRAHRASPAGAGEAAARREDRSARQPDQPALPVQHADVDLVADPHAAGNGAHADHEAVGPAAAPDAQHRSFRHAARGARIDRRVPRHRGRPLRAAAARSTSRSAPTTLDVIVPSMILQPLVENSIKHGLSRKVGGGRITITTRCATATRSSKSQDDGLGMTEERLEHALRRRHRPEQRQRAAAHDLRRRAAS